VKGMGRRRILWNTLVIDIISVCPFSFQSN
jgi:hypothetical protein